MHPWQSLPDNHVFPCLLSVKTIENALNWLKRNNALYFNITTDMNNINVDLKNLGQNSNTSTEACSTSKLPIKILKKLMIR